MVLNTERSGEHEIPIDEARHNVRVYLSRKNLLTLLNKLDRKKGGDESRCTLIKYDTVHPKYPQTHPVIMITALEDEEYYYERAAGPVYPPDDPERKD